MPTPDMREISRTIEPALAPEPIAELAARWPLRERISTRAKYIRVEVRAGGVVQLIIPQNTRRRDAYAFLKTRAEWVEKARQRVAGAAPHNPPLQWDGNDPLHLRGHKCRVQHLHSRIQRPRIRFCTERIEIFAPATASAAQLRRALLHGLREAARIDSTRFLHEEAARLEVSFEGPRIADQKSRWGSCAASGLISLNWRLVMAPPEVLRYVVIHELCHRVHANHSRRFWNLVARQMPNYAEHVTWLRTQGAGLHAALPRP
ncbi:MAG: M48 family metallopeptidase [Sinobacteraceae bacterium]|nr:M48 family metallopeptidase [Nevskiaceae bacterium]